MEIKPNNVETLSYLKNIYCRRKLLRSIQEQKVNETRTAHSHRQMSIFVLICSFYLKIVFNGVNYGSSRWLTEAVHVGVLMKRCVLTSSNRWRRNISKCVSESPCFTTRVSLFSGFFLENGVVCFRVLDI